MCKMTVQYKTTWTMDQADVDSVFEAEQWNSFAFKVHGSSHPVTWQQQPAAQTIEIDFNEQYGAFVTPEIDIADGAVLDNISRFPVHFGVCYSWDGHNLTVDSIHTCDTHSVMLTNNSNAYMTFGLTKHNAKTDTEQPICADMVLLKQSTTYTPVNPVTMYATVGREYQLSSLIKHTEFWVELKLEHSSSRFSYDHFSSSWGPAQDTDPSLPIKPIKPIRPGKLIAHCHLI